MELASFTAVDTGSLRWLRASEEPLEFDLLSGDKPLATLVWKTGPGTLTTARTVGAVWTLKRVGFLNPRVTVRSAGATNDLARISVHFNYHRIHRVGGKSYRFHRAGVLVPAWKVTTEEGVELLHVEPVREARKLVGGAVIATPAAATLDDLPLLAVLSWYFIVLAWFEDEALVPLEGPD